MTIANENKQNTEELTLSARQTKAIPILVACSTYTEGCKKAKVNRTTLYEWLSNPAFRAELEKQQKAVSQQALGMLSQNMRGGLVHEPCLCSSKTYENQLRREHYSIRWLKMLIVGVNATKSIV